MGLLNTKPFQLKMMVALYSRDGDSGSPHRPDTNEFYCETHRVDSSSGKPVLMEGRPATLNQFDRFRDILVTRQETKQEKALITGAMSPRILYADLAVDTKTIVWWRPAALSHVNFTSSTRLKSGSMWLPALLFVAQRDRSLWIFAMHSNDQTPKIFEKSLLYHAPLLNVYQKGNVCLGDVSLSAITSAGTWNDYIAAWENTIFGAKFSHGIEIHGRMVKGDFKKVTATLISNQKKFPLAQLVRHNKFESLDELLEEVIDINEDDE